MRQNMLSTIPVFLTSPVKQLHIISRIRRSNPLPLILCKQSKRFCTNLMCIYRSIFNSPRYTHMCSNILHTCSLPNNISVKSLMRLPKKSECELNKTTSCSNRLFNQFYASSDEFVQSFSLQQTVCQQCQINQLSDNLIASSIFLQQFLLLFFQFVHLI